MQSLKNLTLANLDAAIANGLRELEVVARLYEQRGNLSQAAEIYEAIRQMKEQIAARQQLAVSEFENAQSA